MKVIVLLALFAVVASQRDGLKCFKCDYCHEDDLGDPEICDRDEDVCMKVVAGDHTARMCEKYDTCGIGKLERAASRAWDTIANIFTEVDRDTPLVYCCNDDYCNSSTRELPTIALTLLPLLVVAFFKN